MVGGGSVGFSGLSSGFFSLSDFLSSDGDGATGMTGSPKNWYCPEKGAHSTGLDGAGQLSSGAPAKAR